MSRDQKKWDEIYEREMQERAEEDRAVRIANVALGKGSALTTSWVNNPLADALEKAAPSAKKS